MKTLLSTILLGFVVSEELFAGSCDTCAETEFIRGDVNGDGLVNISDVIHVSQWLCCGGVSDPCNLDAADVNDDGLINNSDVIYLNTFVNLNGPNPPSPFPFPGRDYTVDNLEPHASPGESLFSHDIANATATVEGNCGPLFDEWTNTSASTVANDGIFTVSQENGCKQPERCNDFKLEWYADSATREPLAKDIWEDATEVRLKFKITPNWQWGKICAAIEVAPNVYTCIGGPTSEVTIALNTRNAVLFLKDSNGTTIESIWHDFFSSPTGISSTRGIKETFPTGGFPLCSWEVINDDGALVVTATWTGVAFINELLEDTCYEIEGVELYFWIMYGYNHDDFGYEEAAEFSVEFVSLETETFDGAP